MRERGRWRSERGREEREGEASERGREKRERGQNVGVARWWELKMHRSNEKSNNKSSNSPRSLFFGHRQKCSLCKHYTAYLTKGILYGKIAD